MNRLMTHSVKDRNVEVKGRRDRTALGSARPEVHGSIYIPLIHRKASCACDGGCPACQAKSNDLKVSQPNDPAEIEADHTADKVMRMADNEAKPVANTLNSPNTIHRKCDACEEEEEEIIQRKALPFGGGIPSESPAHVREAIGSGGSPLDRQTRSFFEHRLDHDLGSVRIHTGGTAAKSARAIDAKAYTLGYNIVFNSGEYKPESDSGKHLIAHELAHVAQKNNGSSSLGNNDSLIQRRIRRENVSCQRNGLRNPNLTGDQVVAALEAADADAIDLAQQAETALRDNLAAIRAGAAVDAAFDTILQEELGLTLTNPAHFRLIEQQANRFQRVRETLESGYLRYMCRGSTTAPISVIGCVPAPCGTEFASSCPGNRVIVLCQGFWDTPNERSATLLHEPFHIWFHMEFHRTNALRRADASCFESFALRTAGRAAFASCVGHTNG